MVGGDPGSEHERVRVIGNLTVENRARGARVWVAALTTGDGRRTRTLLGPAWVKDSGRKTARGRARGARQRRHRTPAR